MTYRSPREAALASNRREFLRKSFFGMGALAATPLLANCGESSMSNLDNIGPLSATPDDNGIRLPAGFSSRVIARGKQPVEGTGYTWPIFPDGSATFVTEDKGWILVVNSENFLLKKGGVSAIRFDKAGTIVDAYSVLTGSTGNCAGGPTPWGTWLSCEEWAKGKVFECDPHGGPAVEWPALGIFKHEAAAVDPANNYVYLTEDEYEGRFYRFVPERFTGKAADFGAGKLQALRIVSGMSGPVEWVDVADPLAATTPTRDQVPTATIFDSGEGCYFHDGFVYMTEPRKGAQVSGEPALGRVWAYDVEHETIEIIYDTETDDPVLRGVDNIIATPGGDLLVAEDQGSMQVVAITPSGKLVPVLQVVGQDGSEITGLALDPYRKRLYFGSQRGGGGSGVTYEVTGPFMV